MTYVFADRLDVLGQRMKALNSEPATYKRGATTTQVNATLLTIQVIEQAVGSVIVEREYFQGFALDLAELASEPQKGDKIVRTNGEVFELSPQGEETFRYTTQSRKRVVVFTRRVSGPFK